MYQVMIVDDEQMIVNSLALGFDWKSCGFEVVATSTDSTKALHMIEFIQPDIVFTDIRMPGLSGVELMQKAHVLSPCTKFIIISGHAEFEYAQKSIALGALGYLLKPVEQEEIIALLESASTLLDAQQTLLSSAFTMMLYEPGRKTAAAFLSNLTNGQSLRERMCVACCAGKAASLLSGNVCYTTVPINEGCELYFISSNAEYLASLPFNTALMNAVNTNRVRSFAYAFTNAPLDFLESSLPHLFDAAFSQFIDPRAVVLGQVGREALQAPPADGPFETITAFNEKLACAANANKVVEVLDLLAGWSAVPCGGCRMTHAIETYNLCTALLYRIRRAHYDQPIRFSYELAQLYSSMNEMLNALALQLSRQNIGVADTSEIRNATLRIIIDHLNKNFTQPVSFQQICSENCINPSYLSQLFRKELGVTFTSYVTALRISYAKDLLGSSNLRIQEISEKVGYEYSFNFTKLFKKETGMTPKKYRDAHKKSIP